MSVATLRKQTGLSQQRFAALFEIPVRTLQQWEQGRSAPPDYVVSMMKEILAHRRSTSEQTDQKKWDPTRFAMPEKTRWRICIDEPFMNCERIYPIQQRKVKALLDDVTRDPSVKKVVVFGSSVTERCHQGSDVDLYIELDEAGNPVTEVYDFPFDVWTNQTVDDQLLKEIASKGVVVYE